MFIQDRIYDYDTQNQDIGRMNDVFYKLPTHPSTCNYVIQGYGEPNEYIPLEFVYVGTDFYTLLLPRFLEAFYDPSLLHLAEDLLLQLRKDHPNSAFVGMYVRMNTFPSDDRTKRGLTEGDHLFMMDHILL